MFQQDSWIQIDEVNGKRVNPSAAKETAEPRRKTPKSSSRLLAGCRTQHVTQGGDRLGQ